MPTNPVFALTITDFKRHPELTSAYYLGINEGVNHLPKSTQLVKVRQGQRETSGEMFLVSETHSSIGIHFHSFPAIEEGPIELELLPMPPELPEGMSFEVAMRHYGLVLFPLEIEGKRMWSAGLFSGVHGMTPGDLEDDGTVNGMLEPFALGEDPSEAVAAVIQKIKAIAAIAMPE